MILPSLGVIISQSQGHLASRISVSRYLGISVSRYLGHRACRDARCEMPTILLSFKKNTMTDKNDDFVAYNVDRISDEEMIKRSEGFYLWADKRRSVRDFSSESVPLEVLENILLTASTAPSGSHKQPLTFCLISNAKLKSKLRELAEEEEKKSYAGRMSDEWIEDLAPLGTDWEKEFIDIAPWIIIVMKKAYDFDEGGNKTTNYYVSESVGIASGFLLAAIHNAGLVALTHTPSPMNFISKALNRPVNERPFLLIPVGFPSKRALVPNLVRKAKKDIIEYYD